MNDLGRRKRMELELRISHLDRTEQVLIPLQRQVRVVSTLQQKLYTANGDCFVDLAEDLVESEDVAICVTDRTVEGAEVTASDADVRVIDVAVDYVGNDAIRMLTRADYAGQATEPVRRRLAIQIQ